LDEGQEQVRDSIAEALKRASFVAMRSFGPDRLRLGAFKPRKVRIVKGS